MLQIYLLLSAALITSTINLSAAPKKHKVKSTISVDKIIKAQQSIGDLNNPLNSLSTAINNLNSQCTTQINTDFDAAIKQLENLRNQIEATRKVIDPVKKILNKTANELPVLSHKQEKKIVNNDIVALNQQAKKSPLSADQSNDLKLLNEQIAYLDECIKQDKINAENAAAKYVVLSNNMGKRLHIYSAPKDNPTAWSKKPIKSISPSQKIYALTCDPNYVYRMEINYANVPKLHKAGQLIHTEHRYRRMNRHGNDNGPKNTFSSADNKHQIIINDLHGYSVHTLDYNGVGSLTYQRDVAIATLVASCVAVVLLTAATGGAGLAAGGSLIAGNGILGGLMIADFIVVGGTVAAGVGGGVGISQAEQNRQNSTSPDASDTVFMVLPTN